MRALWSAVSRTGFPRQKVGLDRITRFSEVTVHARVNHHDYNCLFSALNQAVEILYRNRTSDPDFVAAYDTLKQSRAMLQNAVKCSDHGEPLPAAEVAA